MRLYQVYINDLIQQLKSSLHGLMINDLNVTCPSFADDIATGALYKPGLNAHLGVSYAHSRKWRYDFSIEKSVWMVWGEDKSPGVIVKLGNDELKKVSSCTHMGINLCANSNLERQSILTRIGTARGPLLAARGIGSSSVPVPPSVLSQIYWSVGVTRMLYGLDVKPVSDAGLQELESAHREHATIIQGLPNNVPNPAPLATLGWMSISSYVAIMKLRFLWKMLCLPCDVIYKRICLSILHSLVYDGKYPASKLSPICSMYQAVMKYKMEGFLKSCLETDIVGQYGSMKKMIKRVVWENEYMRWRATCMLYRGLTGYLETHKNIQIHAWWKLAKMKPGITRKVSSIMAVFMGGQPRGLQRNMGSNKCGLCGSYTDRYTPLHILFKCSVLENVRKTAWQALISAMPPRMAIDIERKNMSERCRFLLSAWGGSYIMEWTDLYCATVSYVHVLYAERANIYDLMDAGNRL